MNPTMGTAARIRISGGIMALGAVTEGV